MNRRTFLQGSAATLGLAASTHLLGAPGGDSPNDRITVCVMGIRGRGGALLNAFASQPDVDVKYVCDLDLSALASRIEQVKERTGKRPEGIKDYREALDDKNVDALVAGTPDHWHALPTIHACQAGMDVYVEKPDGHNILEGRTMVAAMKKYKRIVQLGTQARSGAMQASAMKYISEGKLGLVRFAKAWESAKQGALSAVPDSDPPAGFDYDTWLGSAPVRPFNSRRWHGNWRWFFDYGTGDLGNDGVHRLDVARWGLKTGVEAKGGELSAFPKSVSAHGGKHYFDDVQEWPDNLMATYDYGNCILTYELRIWSPYPLHGESEGAAIYGDQGYVVIGNTRWRAFDAKGEQILEEPGGDNTTGHARNFLECMRSREKTNADLETVGHPSSLLCHIGNAAWRAGRSLKFDADNYSFFGDSDADQFLTRAEYRKPWVLPEIGQL